MSGDATPVWIFRRFDPVPIYHLPAWLVGRADGGYSRDPDGGEQYRVACGIAYATQSATGNQRDRAQMIRWDHARKIGRLCAHCERIYYGAQS